MEPVNDQRIYSNRYQVTHLIARGGMAMVYRAQDLLLNRFVALKILYPELSADPQFVERFRREAQAAANLSHPNIVPVFDWGEDNGTYFIVMELIDGQSLAALLSQSRTLTPARSAFVIAQVASALGYAHRSGVVHRDVKPGNILLTSDGQVKVTDFGIAQAVSTEDNLTQAGLVMGTATYFSPEQAEGAAVDGRSDVYSLGIVLYELLAGRPPFMGDSPVAVATMHVNSVVPPTRELNPSVPSDLEAITMHALEKRPDMRYQTADEMRADLIRFTEGQPVRAASRNGAFFGDDATRAVAAVSGGERTQAVPLMVGPRTDIRRRRDNRGAIWSVVAVIIILLVGALAYVGLKSSNSGAVSSMPDFVGQTIANAQQTLNNDGLILGSTKLVSSSQPAGTVVGTDPKAGKKVSKGQAVSFNVSEGQSTTPVTVPDEVGQTLSNAESALATLSLAYTVQFTAGSGTNQTPNTVLSQTPIGGSQSRTGKTVTLVVLNPSSTFPVPSLVGDTPSQAGATLGAASLTPNSTTTSQCSNSVTSGDVVASNPAAGSPVKSGSTVTLILSSGVCNVVVPNVVGDTQANATSQLKTQGLTGSFADGTISQCLTYSDQVINQGDAPGSSVPFNSVVPLTYCPALPG